MANETGESNVWGFQTTQWSQILRATGDSTSSEQALAELCQAYWEPLYIYVRRRVASVEDAQDLTQEFFAHLLDRDRLRKIEPDRGRFRGFLLVALKNFLSHRKEAERAVKRGGRWSRIEFDWESAEAVFNRGARQQEQPDAAFERQWALTVLRRAKHRWLAEGSDKQSPSLHKHLQHLLTTNATFVEYETIGAEVGIQPASVKTALHRARRRLGELIRQEVLATIDHPDELEQEIQKLREALQC